MSEKTILCYGDSNTWGWNPATQDRYARHERWPGVLRQELGEGYLVIEEGLNGRTTVWDVDGIHLDLSEHPTLGEAVAARVRQML